MQGAGAPSDLLAALDGRPVLRERDRYVAYFERAQFETLLRDAGLDELRVEGSHYFAEGPFWQSVDAARLDEAAVAQDLIDAEAKCAAHPAAARLARAWAAAARKA